MDAYVNAAAATAALSRGVPGDDAGTYMTAATENAKVAIGHLTGWKKQFADAVLTLLSGGKVSAVSGNTGNFGPRLAWAMDFLQQIGVDAADLSPRHDQSGTLQGVESTW